VIRAVALAVLAAAALAPVPVMAANCDRTSTGLMPIPDLGGTAYLGQEGGLYPGGRNTPPPAYAAAGLRAAAAVVPRDARGGPDAGGKIVLLSIGMSNTLIEYATFLRLEGADSAHDPHVVMVNGAEGGQDAKAWVDRTAPAWSFLEGQLARAGVTDAQVEVVWLKQAQAGPTSDFPTYRDSLAGQMAAIVADAAARFPNLQQVFVSPRTYAGYATTRLNPEPYAYQTGFADRQLVAQSVAQPQSRPWVGWGPYLWTDGTKGRSDGFTWSCADVRTNDGTHPSDQGAAKVAQLLQQFFQSSQFTPWFRTGVPLPAKAGSSGPPLWLAVAGALILLLTLVAGWQVLRRLRSRPGIR